MMKRRNQQGFTLVEMIIVIVITGIIGGIVAVFIRAPVQGYVDSARRAGMTDIADTALRRVTRDLRLALPNSVRVSGVCGDGTTCYLEFIPTKGGGRYRAGPPGDQLLFTTADTSFEVLGPMPGMDSAAIPPDQIVVYNLGITGADAYAGSNRTAVFAAPAGAIANITSKKFPFDSPGHRFHVVTSPVSFACSQNSANPAAGTLALVTGYGWGALPGTGTANLLATNVSACRFTYDPLVVGRTGLVTMHLSITVEGETVTLYNAAHVSNQP
jgi:MSHA biogenesis protein MshO